jgi:hypothetical protein
MRLTCALLALLLALLGCAEEEDMTPGDDDDATVTLPTCAGGVMAAFTEDEIDPPQPDSEDYPPPGQDALDALRDGLQAFLDDDLEGAMERVGDAGYEVCAGTGDEEDLVLFRPDTAGSGHALFAVRTTSARPLILGAPHVWLEYGVLEEAVATFEQVDGRALIITGNHRCSNDSPAGCDGSTTVCGSSEPYRESDMAHVVDSHYHVAHEVLADHFADDWVMSMHGFWMTGVSVSNGTHEPTEPDTPVALFAGALMDTLPGEYVTACSTGTDAPRDVRYCGTTNVQGRYVNGSPDPCYAEAAVAAERFIHLEQFVTIWAAPQPVIDALDAVLPTY